MTHKTFEAWLRTTLDADQIADLAEHGADAGWPGLTYYSDTCALYDTYHEEIWEALNEDADDFGVTPLALVAQFRMDATDDTTFKNLLVWYMAERVARALSD